MDTTVMVANARIIQNEIEWFRTVLEQRFLLHAGEHPLPDPLDACPPPQLDDGAAPYAAILRQYQMKPAERLVLMLGFLPHIKPDALDLFFIQNQSVQRRFTEFGGLTGLSHNGFLPTAETALFLLAGSNLDARLRYHHLFHPTHFFFTENILRLNHRHPEEPLFSAAVQVTPEYLERLTTGKPYQPPFSTEFPAHRLTTPYEWKDLVLDPLTEQDVADMLTWIRHQTVLLDDWRLRERLKAGYRTLFYGPPGTGKTLTASLLGKMTDTPVYRIDLSQVVSKYIGETEKNLASLFDHAQHQNWILFFDEADTLFGKRTESRNANDRAANQQISYLLQRIEDFPGVVILATNLRSHLDAAFARRFQSIIHFPVPNPEQRLRLWTENFVNKPYPLAADVNFRKLADAYELAGGNIINVLRFPCLKAITRTPPLITSQDLELGVRRELHKDGIFLSGQ
ncbi:MAG: ATP-binding protein [Blastocatellia bacterium]|nr:ATP-binding protein [Blastocatellia bacterium]